MCWKVLAAGLAILCLCFYAHQRLGGGKRVGVVLAEHLAPAEEAFAKESKGVFEIIGFVQDDGQIVHRR